MSVCVIGNAYGIFVNDSENFTNRTKISTMRQLRPTHRVSLLLPTVEHWWHQESRQLIKELFERVINDIRGVIELPEFQQACIRFGITNVSSLSAAIQAKYMNGKKNVNGHNGPAIFNAKIYNGPTIPSKINVPLGVVTRNGELEEVSWGSLLGTSYLHISTILEVRGFKLTRSGITFDISVEHMVYTRK